MTTNKEIFKVKLDYLCAGSSALTKHLWVQDAVIVKEDDASLAQKNELQETPKVEAESANTQ
jgi:hypothetical protein